MKWLRKLFKRRQKEQEIESDFAEQYGCVCCGSGYRHLRSGKHFYSKKEVTDNIEKLNH